MSEATTGVDLTGKLQFWLSPNSIIISPKGLYSGFYRGKKISSFRQRVDIRHGMSTPIMGQFIC